MRRWVAWVLATVMAAGCGTAAAAPGPAASPAACTPLTIPSPALSAATPRNDPTPGFALAIGASPVGIAVAGGYVWAAETGSSKLVAIRVSDGSQREYSLPSSQLGFNLAVAADGRIWTAEQYRGAIAGVALDGSVRECKLGKGAGPVGVATAADGTLWVTESDAGAVARLKPGTAAFETFKMPTGGGQPTEVLPVAGGAYVTQIAGDSVIHLSNSGQVTEIPLGVSRPQAIGLLQAPDGALWVAEFGADRLARISGGQVTQVAFPAGSKPQSLAVSGGRLLVTSSGGDRIDSVDLASGAFAAGPHTGRWPDHLALAPDGSAWFTEYYGGRVARLP